MMQKITARAISDFKRKLRLDERAPGTIEKYLRDVGAFAAFVGEAELSKESTAAWKERLLSSGYSPRTVNSMLAAIHRFLDFIERHDCCVRYLKVQRRVFRSPERELNRSDYESLVSAAQSAENERLALLIETICATGIRVSEVKYITVEAAQTMRSEISLKGKIRTILIPGKLAKKLVKYAKKQKIALGEIFITESGRGLSRRQIWAEMKRLAKRAGVSPDKVFPHNLRHLFARTFYRVTRDIARLADVLGHSSIETTRIYLMTTADEQSNVLERLGLVV